MKWGIHSVHFLTDQNSVLPGIENYDLLAAKSEEENLQNTCKICASHHELITRFCFNSSWLIWQNQHSSHNMQILYVMESIISAGFLWCMICMFYFSAKPAEPVILYYFSATKIFPSLSYFSTSCVDMYWVSSNTMLCKLWCIMNWLSDRITYRSWRFPY